MNRLKLIAFATLCAALVSVTSCNKREYDKPPMRTLTIDTVFTIDQILGMGATSFNFAEGVTGGVYGVVTADEVSGNLYKAAYMQDRATGKAINLYMSSSSGLRIGDSICVILNGMVASTYMNLPQIGSSDTPIDPDENIVILDNRKFIEPEVTTIANINAKQHTAQLIKLENVYFVQPGLNYAEDGGYGERTIKDAAGNTVMIRTSNYANFAKQKTPTGTGSIVAINSVYNTTQQLYIRSINEVVFDGSGGGGGGGLNPAGEVQNLPYSQSFEADFGTYTTKDVMGDQSWEIDFSTAKMTGYVGGTNYANEDWLISSPVSLQNVTEAKVEISYICRYFASLNDDMTIQVSTDYVYGEEPSSATWTKVPFTWTSGTNWTDFATTEANLTDYAGQTITLAVKYLSNDVKAGTAEIKSITISEGTTGGGGGGGGGTAGETQTLPYLQSFDTEFGTYTTKDVMGDQSWTIDYSTAKMTGYVGGTNYANEDWLISSPVSLENVTEAKVTVSYICRYFANINEDMTIQVSTDYVYGEEPSSATWTKVPFTWTSGTNWTDFATTEGSLTDYAGQTITLAVKYLSTDVKAGTAEIKSITISEGTTGGGGGGGGTTGNAEGTGTQDDPYNVAAAIQNQNNSTAWVTGYIVGAVKTGTMTISSNDDVIWGAAVNSKTNIVLADNQTETNIDNCVIVSLPTGAIRDAVNLQDNAGNLGKEFSAEGVLRPYFGKPGLRDLTGNYTLEGQGGGGDDNYTYYLNETLLSQTSFDNFSTFNVDGDQEWTMSTSYGAVMSGYADSASYANEDWLISPAIDLSTATNPVLTFDHARGPAASINIGVAEGYYTVWITNSYADSDDPTDNLSAWTELTGITHGTTAWQYVSSGEIAIPAAFMTATCRIAFRYISINGASATWEVKNVKVKE